MKKFFKVHYVLGNGTGDYMEFFANNKEHAEDQFKQVMKERCIQSKSSAWLNYNIEFTYEIQKQ